MLVIMCKYCSFSPGGKKKRINIGLQKYIKLSLLDSQFKTLGFTLKELPWVALFEQTIADKHNEHQLGFKLQAIEVLFFFPCETKTSHGEGCYSFHRHRCSDVLQLMMLVNHKLQEWIIDYNCYFATESFSALPAPLKTLTAKSFNLLNREKEWMVILRHKWSALVPLGPVNVCKTVFSGSITLLDFGEGTCLTKTVD